MGIGTGKAKGSAYERECCKNLSLWLSRGLRDDLFWRSAMSGGRATVKFKSGGKNQTQSGDITAIDSQGEKLTSKFLIECKWYQDLNITSMMLDKGSLALPAFWKKAIMESTRCGRLPMMLAKQNFFPDMVVLDHDGINFFNLGVYYSAYFQVHHAYIVLWAKFVNHARRP